MIFRPPQTKYSPIPSNDVGVMAQPCRSLFLNQWKTNPCLAFERASSDREVHKKSALLSALLRVRTIREIGRPDILMAEILGAVAATAQLAQLSAQILSSGYSFLSKAAKAPSEVRQLLTETAALDCVLGRLQNIPRSTTPTTSATPPTDDPVVALHRSGIFKQCTDLLASVQKALDSFVEVDRQRIANLTKRLAWPLREKEVTDALQRLARLRGIISTAIEARSVYVVTRKGRFDQANIKLTPLYKCTAERSCASKPHKRSWLIWSRV